MHASIPMPRSYALLAAGLLALSVSAARAEKADESLLKKGTPDIEFTVVFNQNPTGFENCGPLYSAASGQALSLKTITGFFGVPPGGFGGVQLQVTLLGGKTSTLDVPMQRTAPVQQEAGPYDQYAGSLELGGIPVIGLQACVEGINSVLELEAVGYVVTTS